MKLKVVRGGWLWLWVIIYAGLLALVVWSLMSARRRALAELATPESVRDWQAWREDVERQQDEPSPVRRRVPASAEPPGLVLMRDYFAVTMTGAILFSTVLYWITAWFVSGMLHSPQAAPESATYDPESNNQ